MSTTLSPTVDTLSGRNWPDDPTDEAFVAAYVDVDEQREEPAPHRYIHGGFRGTDTRFSFYLPPRGSYGGRFFQHVTPVPQSENLAQGADGANRISFSVASGAYFVETNGGGPDAANPFSGLDPAIGAYRANAAAARFSRVVASEVFGEHRAYGYLYGGSGGGFRTIGSSENTHGVWDGFVPYVIGSPMAMPNVFSVRMHAQRILRDRFPAIVDAYDAGGDPSALELTPDEAAAFEEVTRMGFPPRSWFGWRTMGMHGFSALYPGVMAADPTFASDFWTEPGYLGADPSGSVHRDRVVLTTSIAELITEAPAGSLAAGGVDESFRHATSAIAAIRLADAPDGWVLGAQLTILTGAASGTIVRLSGVEGSVATLESGQDAALVGLAVGDDVQLDNSNFLAAQTYHRHQVPDAGYAVWDQFRGAGGEPLHPQRPMLLGPLFTRSAAGTVPSGEISGKMIVVACLLDREAFPWQADWYRSQVAASLGDQTDQRFRLWYIDNALHGDDDPQEFPTRSISYLGALETALRQLAAWVEDGVEPAPTTTYEVIDGQVVVPDRADERRGVQPVAGITVSGALSATVKVGEPVVVRIEAECPGGGVVVEVVADLDGSGTLGEALAVEPGRQVELTRQCTFNEPGTYFVAARVAAQTDGNPTDPHGRVLNLARARVTVTG